MSGSSILHIGHLGLVGLVVLVATFSFALWKGGLAERIGGSLNLAAGLFVIVINPALDAELQPVALLVVDAALAMGFLFLAVRYASLWLGAAMLLQAVQFSLHAYYLMVERPPDGLHAWINNSDTTLINLMIVIGTASAWRRRGRLEREEAAKAEATALPS